MKNVFNASEELFFDILIIALLSFLYFNYISMSKFTLLLGLIFSFIYFGVNEVYKGISLSITKQGL